MNLRRSAPRRHRHASETRTLLTAVAPASSPDNGTATPSLGELIRVFLRISLLGFGGPNAHLALMLDEVVDRRGWLTREHFLHLIGITNLLPGPNSSEVAIHIGYTQRGWRGALATGLAFLAPTFLLVVLFSYLYFRFGTLPEVEGVFWGLKPAILAVILAAGWKLARVALGLDRKEQEEDPGREDRRSLPGLASRIARRTLLFLMALGGLATSIFLDRWEVGAMALGGVLGWALLRKGQSPPGTGPGRSGKGRPGSSANVESTRPSADRGSGGGSEESSETRGGGDGEEPGGEGGEGNRLMPALILAPGAASLLPSLASPLGQLFALTLGAGAVLFGGGYMLVALLEPFVVEAYGWLSPQEFLDGIALTQAIPGPIVTLVAFVGFAVAGVPGAAVATAGIYIPSFAAVLLVAPALERWRHQDWVAGALRGVNAVVAGAILGVGLTLIPSAVTGLWSGMILMVALVALIRFRAKAVWMVVGGVVAGLLHLLLT